MTNAKHFPFCVEVKRREAWSLLNLAKGRPSPVWAWWKQACDAAEACGKMPLLWLRENRDQWRVMLPAVAVDEEAGRDVGLVFWSCGSPIVDALEERPVLGEAKWLLLMGPEFWV